MLPSIDPAAVGAAASVSGAAQSQRAEMDRVIEAYKVAPVAADEAKVGAEAGQASRTAAAVARPEAIKTKRNANDLFKRPDDQAEVAFQVTREEREVFLNYASGNEDIDELSEHEQTTLQRVAERLDKLIEAASERNAKGMNRINAAMKEWYSRLAGGKEAPEQLIALIQRASQGKMDDKL